MEKKLEIIESNSEVSKDKLWLKPVKEGMSLLHYGSNGWESVLSKSVGSISSLKDIPDSEIKKLSGEETLDILYKFRDNINKMPPEEYVKSINVMKATISSMDAQAVNDYINAHKIGKTYKTEYGYIDRIQVIPVIQKGSVYKLSDINPDLYVKFKKSLDSSSFNDIVSIVKASIQYFNRYYISQDRFSSMYVIKNDTEVVSEEYSLSDVVEVINKSTENGCTEVQDGFRPRLKSGVLYVDSVLSILEYHELRSPDNIVQEFGKSIIIKNNNNEFEEYKVIKKDNFTLKDFYLCFFDNSQEETYIKYRNTVLEFVGKKPNYIYIDDILKIKYIQNEEPEVLSNINKGDVIVSKELPHIFFTITDPNISIEDLKNFKSYIQELIVTNSYLKFIRKYYSPYEDYKYEIDDPNNQYYTKNIEQAEEAKTKLEALLDKLKDKISYDGEIIITEQTQN